MKRIMIAGTTSGVGKTTISTGIMAALTKRGKQVAPFKVGPDYIDPKFHQFVTANPSYNLDSWLLSQDILRYLFKKNTKGKDIAIIEGVMGLYDGYGITRDNGSSAHVAKLINSPVILLIDGSGMSTSAAAMVAGYKLYDEQVPLQGVIINKVSGEGHYQLLKEAIEKQVGIPCLGYLPRNLDISLKSRHLGLIPVEEIEQLKAKVGKLVEIVEKSIDLDLLLKISDLPANKSIGEKLQQIEKNPLEDLKAMAEGLRIGIARDKAFNFYYQDNLNLLKEMGVELVPFSPLKGKELPDNINGVYIGGGFPEVFASELENNKPFRQNLKKHLEQGLPAYAECGGLIYLTEGIKGLDGTQDSMVGFLPAFIRMTEKLQRFGYVNIETDSGITIKGHEFHYTLLEEQGKLDYKYKVYKIKDGAVSKQWKCGLARKNTLAAYPHIHFYSNPEFLLDLIKKCREVNYKS